MKLLHVQYMDFNMHQNVNKTMFFKLKIYVDVDSWL